MRYPARCLSVASGASAGTLLSSSSATVQDIHPLLLEGGLVPGVGLVDQFRRNTADDKGTWLAVVETNCPAPVCDEVLLENGVVIAREGDPLLQPLGTTREDFHEVSIHAAGEHACGCIVLGSVPPVLGEVVTFEGQTVLPAGTEAVFPQFSLGTKHIAFLDVPLDDNRRMLASAHVDDLCRGEWDDPDTTKNGGLSPIELPIEPTRYCEAEINSLGCAPAVYAMGTPSASSSLPFMLNGTQLINESSGLLACGFNEGEMPFMGGTLCIAGTVERTPPLWTDGNPAIPPDCSGSTAFDFNAFLQGGLDPQLIAGEDVFTQFWSRDGGDHFGINLTDAIKFTILQ